MTSGHRHIFIIHLSFLHIFGDRCRELDAVPSTAYMMEERVQQIGQWWSSDMNKCQALVLPCSADKSIECAFPRSLYCNKPSLAINHFSRRDSVPTFTGPDRVALLANFTVVTMDNQEQFFFCQRYHIHMC